jgi:hypothetical protein
LQQRGRAARVRSSNHEGVTAQFRGQAAGLVDRPRSENDALGGGKLKSHGVFLLGMCLWLI